MSYLSQVEAAGAAADRIRLPRREPLRADYYSFDTLLPDGVYSASIAERPDGVPLDLPSLGVVLETVTQTVAGWVASGIAAREDLPGDAADDADVAVSVLRLSASTADVATLPRNTVQPGAPVTFYFAVFQPGGDTVVAGELVITETA